MKRLKRSVVAWSFLGSLVSFGILFYTMPYDRFLDFALAVAFGVCFAATVRYGRDAVMAFRSGKSGAEFLLVAVFSIVAVLLGQRAWNITLRVLDRPDWLVDSPMTIAIPWLLSWAVSLALVAPDIDLEPEAAKASLWKSGALFIGGVMAGMAVAVAFSSRGATDLSQIISWPQLQNRASCPADKPVWVSSKGIYHVPGSPYRGMIIPRWCMGSVKDAEERGFRPPRGSKAAG